jgi:hypothetical protein
MTCLRTSLSILALGLALAGPAAAKNCRERIIPGTPSDTELQAKIAAAHSGDACAIAMHQAKSLVGSARFLGRGDADSESAGQVVCYLEQARERLQAARGRCGSRRFEFREMDPTGTRRSPTNDAEVAASVVDDMMRMQDVGTPAAYLAYVEARLAEARARREFADQVTEARRLRRQHSKDKNLAAYQAGIEQAVSALRALARKAECQRRSNCGTEAANAAKQITDALYEDGGALRAGPSRAQYEAEQRSREAKAAAAKAASAAFQTKQERMQVLMAAAFGGRVGQAKQWLDKGLDPDITYPDFEGGKSALMLFARQGKREGVELLLARGAIRDLKDSRGKTAADICRESAKCGADILALLTGAGAASPVGAGIIELRDPPPPQPVGGPQQQKMVAKLQAGDLKVGALLVMMASYDAVGPHLDPMATSLRSWRDNPREVPGMTSRQVYGSILANWAAYKPGLASAKRVTYLREALADLTSAPLQAGVMAQEAAEITELLEPGAATASRYRDQALELYFAGADAKAPPPIRLAQLALATSLLRHPAYEAKRKRNEAIILARPGGKRAPFRGTPEALLAKLRSAIPPGSPPALEKELVDVAGEYQPRLRLTRR